MIEKTMIYITGYVCHWYYRKNGVFISL